MVLAAVAAVIYGAFRAAPWIAGRLGSVGMDIAGRVSGLVLASIGVGVVAAGLVDLFPGLAR